MPWSKAPSFTLACELLRKAGGLSCTAGAEPSPALVGLLGWGVVWWWFPAGSW